MTALIENVHPHSTMEGKQIVHTTILNSSSAVKMLTMMACSHYVTTMLQGLWQTNTLLLSPKIIPPGHTLASI